MANLVYIVINSSVIFTSIAIRSYLHKFICNQCPSSFWSHLLVTYYEVKGTLNVCLHYDWVSITYLLLSIIYLALASARERLLHLRSKTCPCQPFETNCAETVLPTLVWSTAMLLCLIWVSVRSKCGPQVRRKTADVTRN